MWFSPYLGSRLSYYTAVCLALFGLLSTPARAQSSGQSLSMHEAIANTLAKNPQLHQFTVKKQGLLGRRDSSELRQTLTLNLALENFGGSGDLSGAQASETFLALSSVIELGGKRQGRVSVANAQLHAFDDHRQAFTLDVLAQLTRVFIQALEIQERLTLAQEARALTRSTLTIVKTRSQQGATSEAEVKRAAAALAQAQLQLNALQQQRERLLVKLAAYWGETSPSWTRVEGDLYAFGQTSSFASLYERALASPAIAVFASEARLKQAELALAKTQSSFDIGWQLGVRQFEASGDTAFTAGVSIPLFGDKRNRGALQTAMAAQNELDYERQTALLKLHVQLFEAYSQRRQHVAAVKAYRSTILPDLNTALRSTQKAYEAGRYSYQDWIAAQKELLDAKRSLIENAAAAALNQAVIEQLIAEPLYSSADISQ